MIKSLESIYVIKYAINIYLYIYIYIYIYYK